MFTVPNHKRGVRKACLQLLSGALLSMYLLMHVVPIMIQLGHISVHYFATGNLHDGLHIHADLGAHQHTHGDWINLGNISDEQSNIYSLHQLNTIAFLPGSLTNTNPSLHVNSLSPLMESLSPLWKDIHTTIPDPPPILWTN